MSLTISLSTTDRKSLRDYAKQYANSWQITKRLEAIRLLDTGLSASMVSKQLCVNTEVIYKYVKTYQEKGIDGLINLERPGREAKITEKQLSEVEAYIERCQREGVRCTASDQAAFVKEQYNIDIGTKWIYKRLLIRRQSRLDGALATFGVVTPFAIQLATLPGLKRYSFFAITHTLFFLSTFQYVKV